MNSLNNNRRRLVSYSPHANVPRLIDALRDFQTGPDWQKPVNLYVAEAEQGERPLSAADFLEFYRVLRSSPTPIHTLGIGCLDTYEALLVSSGTKGYRRLLDCASISLSAFIPANLPDAAVHRAMTSPFASEGLNRARKAAHEIEFVLRELGLNAEFWKRPQAMCLADAVTQGICDEIIPLSSLPTRAARRT